MLHLLRRHPLPMRATFGHSLVLTYALEPAVLAPLLAPGLSLDTYRDPDGVTHAFVAIGLVSVRRLRPAGLPGWLGGDTVLTGYRIFARFPTPSGQSMRGLLILRSDTGRRLIALGGNVLTHYHYHVSRIRMRREGAALTATVDSRGGTADLVVRADLAASPELPAGSVFPTMAAARRFAGPLPYTFSYERRTGSMIVVKARRSQWRPEPVSVDVSRLTFFDAKPFAGTRPVLANAFHVAELDYGWARGSRRGLDGSLR